MAMIEAWFLVPEADNDGKPFPESAFVELETELAEAFGGWTYAGDVTGGWIGEAGKLYTDNSRRYVLALQSWRQVHKLLRLVDRVANGFEQEAIYLTIAGIPEIVERERGG